jgi:two-component system, NtrC family, sensor histidine kinase HydH
MSAKRKNPFKQVMHSSPWIILGSVAILLITVIIVLAVQNYNHEKLYMSCILSEKGAALIKGLEAGSRTGMMGMVWGGQQIQTLIEETALLPDVLYIMITNREGLVSRIIRSRSVQAY